MGPTSMSPNLMSSGALTAIPWRKQNVSKTTNEIYIDFFEEIDAIVERFAQHGVQFFLRISNGSLSYSKISGTLEVDSQLSGMPDLVLKVLGAHSIDDIGYVDVYDGHHSYSTNSFHPCVRLKRWEQERVISFIPPDGKFQMAKYM